MSSRKVVRGLKKLGARYRIERESVSNEIGESCRGRYAGDLDRNL